VNTRKEWDRIFFGLNEETAGEDARLERWRHVLEASRGSPVLDLGCGAGHDALFLTELGFSVFAADFSQEALEITRRKAPAAKAENVDLTRGLPFPEARFGAIVASLSLHYFPWHQTLQILDEVRRYVGPGGFFLARFNSTRDPYYSAAEKRRIGNNFYLVGGMPKRLFDRRDIAMLFATGWETLAANERATRRYGGGKVVWEVATKKPVTESEGRRPEAC
jgi:SAM-dependent methyltransferase